MLFSGDACEIIRIEELNIEEPADTENQKGKEN